VNGRTVPPGLIVALVLMLYGLACVAPAVRGRDRPVPGIRLLVGGGEGPRYAVPWSANVLLGAGLLAVRRRQYRIAAALGWAATGLALTAWAIRDQTYLVGYYFWQASPILLVLGARVLASQQTAATHPARRP
jgi:hypothetical protein